MQLKQFLIEPFMSDFLYSVETHIIVLIYLPSTRDKDGVCLQDLAVVLSHHIKTIKWQCTAMRI